MECVEGRIEWMICEEMIGKKKKILEMVKGVEWIEKKMKKNGKKEIRVVMGVKEGVIVEEI